MYSNSLARHDGHWEHNPDVASEFHKGILSFTSPEKELSAMAIDQAHEQNNAVIKGDGVLLA